MGDVEVVTAAWRFVERGRVVLFSTGPYEGKLAAIAEIIDHKRVLVDNPNESVKVPRHACPLKHLVLTPIVIPNVPNGARTGAIRKQWKAAQVDKQWADSAWAKSRERSQKRRQLTDFQRFKVMRARKTQRFEVRKTAAKIKAATKA